MENEGVTPDQQNPEAQAPVKSSNEVDYNQMSDTAIGEKKTYVRDNLHDYLVKIEKAQLFNADPENDRVVLAKNNPNTKYYKCSFIMTYNVKTSTDNTYYEIQPVSYIPQGGNDKIIIHSGNSETRAKGTIPETNMFFGVGKQVQITIVYEDMEGTEYKTKITTSSGNVSSVSIKRLKSA